MLQQGSGVLRAGGGGRAGHFGQGEEPGQLQGHYPICAGADHKFQENELSDSLPLYASPADIIIPNSRYIDAQPIPARVPELPEPLRQQ